VVAEAMSNAVRHRCLTVLLAVFVLLELTACDLDAVPRDPTRDIQTLSDAGADAVDQVCSPGQTRCQGPLPLVEQCNAEGTGYVHSESCAAGTYCSEGDCKPLATQCERSGDESLPFSLSRTTLNFETSDDLKSSTASLRIENCGDSDIWLKRTEIRASSPSAGRSVFSVVNAANFQELRIPPGISETVSVKYEPAFAFSREPGLLRLQIIGDRYHEFDIPLRPRSYCVSATPGIDTGLIQGTERGSVFVHNCGTEPVTLDSISTVPDKDDSQPQASIYLDQRERPHTLEEGEFLEIPYRVSGSRLGLFNHRIVYELEDASKFGEERLATTVTGRVASVDCRSLTLPPPLVEPESHSQTDWEATAKIGERIEVSMRLPVSEAVAIDQLTPIFRFRPPEGSRSVWEPFDSTFPALGKNRFTPDVPGTYRIDMNYINEDGRPLCEWKTLRVDVRPQEEFYVEVGWKTHGDLIGDDVGFGRGADLNLHVLPATDDEADLLWGETNGDCFGYGEYPTTDPTLASKRSKCGLFQGEVHSTSVSGAHREAIGFTAVSQDRYYIAVHAWSLSGFPNAVADIRLFHRGEQVESFELAEGDWYEDDPPDSLEDVLQHRLRSTNDVWILGYWDADEETLIARPTRYSGFPN
jgi:hypothetical protein